MGLTTSGAAGWPALIWSWKIRRATVRLERLGGSSGDGSLSSERNWYWRPSAPSNRSDLVCLPPPALRGPEPAGEAVADRARATRTGVVHRSR